MSEILGYRPIDLLGQPCYKFYSENDVDHMKESFEQGNYSILINFPSGTLHGPHWAFPEKDSTPLLRILIF